MSQGSVARNELIQGEERTISKSNMKVDLEKLPCHPTCQIIVEILMRHFIRLILMNSSKVPEVYLTQFWESLEVSQDNKTMTVRIDQKTIKFDVKIFRSVLGLPAAVSRSFKAFCPLPSFDTIVSFLR